MKLEHNTDRLSTSNLEVVREHIKAGIDHITYQGLLCILADVCDTAAGNRSCYLTLGVTRDGDAFIMTVRDGVGKAYAGGISLAELSKDAEKLV